MRKKITARPQISSIVDLGRRGTTVHVDRDGTPSKEVLPSEGSF